jgi:hypothetical protein
MFALTSQVLDKGKPTVTWGRKAMGHAAPVPGVLAS